MTETAWIKFDTTPANMIATDLKYIATGGWIGDLPSRTQLTFPSGRVITLAEIDRLLTAWDGWEPMDCTIDEGDAPTEAEYLEYAEAQAAAEAARNDPHASDCRIWVGETCDCVMGRIEL